MELSVARSDLHGYSSISILYVVEKCRTAPENTSMGPYEVLELVPEKTLDTEIGEVAPATAPLGEILLKRGAEGDNDPRSRRDLWIQPGLERTLRSPRRR